MNKPQKTLVLTTLLLLPLASPHRPIVPTQEWQGKSGLGAYGDFVMATDWALGQVIDALDAAGIAGNTLLIFTSDNGCSPAAGVARLMALMEKIIAKNTVTLRYYRQWESGGGALLPCVCD